MAPPLTDLTSSSDFLCRDTVIRHQTLVGSTGNVLRNVYYHVSGNVANVSAAEVMSLDGNNTTQLHFVGRRTATPLVLADLTTTNLATWSASSSLLTLGRDTTTLRSNTLVVGNLVANSITGNLTSFTIGSGAESRPILV